MRVDLRGTAAFSCLGLTRTAQVEALRRGQSGLEPLGPGSLFGEERLRAGQIPEAAAGEDRARRLLELLLEELVEDAGLSRRERRGCAIFAGAASGIGSSEEIATLEKIRAGKPWQSDLLSGGPGRFAAFAAERLGARGPLFTYTTACTSTAVALFLAVRLLRAGRVERAVVLGIDVLMKISIEGFRSFQLYSEGCCRPFDRDRDGLQIGEAAVGLVLETSRGAKPARFGLLDGALAHDQSHIAAGSNDGRTAAALMTETLSRSAVRSGEVASVKAHGTGTVTNDLSELRGLAAAFGAPVPPFASLKGALGHTLGSSAALETVAWTWCLAQGFVPASQGFARPCDELPLAPLTESLGTEGRPGVHLCNAFGFGGTSVSYLLDDRGAP
ncbi:MAG: hypothetical protein HY900_03185 [Deltaproteobacteria bacterium]|nr:hypothetical protein [Deltaproteobacteria bacterium]